MKRTMWDDYAQWIWETYHIYNKSYTSLFRELLNIPFVVVLDRDENRLGDAEAIRDRYFAENGISGSFIDHKISVLEVLLGLSIRVDNEYVGNPRDPHPETIFWEMLDNLGLNKYINSRFSPQKVHEIVDIFVYREYDFDGYGGIFPLKNPKKDQKNVEIWDQCMAYLTENWL